jgi:hypothetical protein
MTILRYLLLILLVAISFITGSLLERHGVLNMAGTHYLKTTEPLLLNTEGEPKYYHLLPAGTALYKDVTFPEGHTRYIAYINIKGAFGNEPVDSPKTNLVDPIWAYTIKPDEVKALMADAPISKADLVRILKARDINREELVQILREWEEKPAK